MRFSLLGLCVVLFSSASFAQAEKGVKKPDLQWRLIGRVFFDGGFFMNDHLNLGSSFQVNDVRLGTVLTLFEDWEAKIELGYADKAISFKDIYLSYAWKRHVFKLGHQYEPFGYARIGSSNYRFMQHATADEALGTSRKLGLTYSYDRDWWNVMAGVFSNGNVQSGGQLEQGYTLSAKVIARPWMTEKKLLHIGVAPVFIDGKDEVSFGGGVPTMLLADGDNAFLDATVNNVINQWKLDVEGILLCNKWYFQGQYYL